MGKIDANKLMKKNALFQTSFDLFMEKGFAKTTISDIVRHAGLAKGTFYLYFKDKYDLRDRLVIYKTGQLFAQVHNALLSHPEFDFEEMILFVVDYCVQILSEDRRLMRFISKNLSWGIFFSAAQKNIPEESGDFYKYYIDTLNHYDVACRNPELMLFTIIELIGSTCYSCILYEEPVSMEEYLPYLKETVLQIVSTYTQKARVPQS